MPREFAQASTGRGETSGADKEKHHVTERAHLAQARKNLTTGDHIPAGYGYASVAYGYHDSPTPPQPVLPDHDALMGMCRIRDRDHQAIP